jgi:hypothetical protein
MCPAYPTIAVVGCPAGSGTNAIVRKGAPSARCVALVPQLAMLVALSKEERRQTTSGLLSLAGAR